MTWKSSISPRRRAPGRRATRRHGARRRSRIFSSQPRFTHARTRDAHVRGFRGFAQLRSRPPRPRPRAPRPAPLASAPPPPPPRRSDAARRSTRPGFQETGRVLPFFRPCEGADVPRVAEIEANSYPADEAASPENQRVPPGQRRGLLPARRPLRRRPGRRRRARELRLRHPRRVIICSARVHGRARPRRRDAVCVCVWRSREGNRSGRRRSRRTCAGSSPRTRTWRPGGSASASRPRFYEGAGFKMVGPSDVVHGADQWYEMAMKPRSRGRSSPTRRNERIKGGGGGDGRRLKGRAVLRASLFFIRRRLLV